MAESSCYQAEGLKTTERWKLKVQTATDETQRLWVSQHAEKCARTVYGSKTGFATVLESECGSLLGLTPDPGTVKASL